MADIVLSGLSGRALTVVIGERFRRGNPEALAVASAFVSVGGIEQATAIQRECQVGHVRLIAGLAHCVTHPEALVTARRAGWELRLWTTDVPLFHPKILIASLGFGGRGRIVRPVAAYIGSANLTGAGFLGNVECGAIVDDTAGLAQAASSFERLWQSGVNAELRLLRTYADRFAAASRRRTASELVALSIADGQRLSSRAARNIRRAGLRPRPVVGIKSAAVAWTGLESFTGEYRFQIEFPRAAGEVVRQIVRLKGPGGGTIPVLCADGSVRDMQYRFYTDNSMFRLNVPNDLPGVAWARQNRRGVAVIESWSGDAVARLKLLRPGRDGSQVVARSIALGTWGRTTTRLYGWF